MKKLALAVFALAVTAPAHAISVVSLHMAGGGGGGMTFATNTVSAGLMLASIAVLAVIVGVRALRRSRSD